MNKKVKYLIFAFTFLVVFCLSAIVRIQLLGSAPMKLIEVDWNENIGRKYTDLDYKNDNGNKYDLYIPKNLDKSKNQYLILFIHGGSFNSGSKEDGDVWCKYYASKGYITATVDYTLQNHGKEASIFFMNEEIENAVQAIKVNTSELGYNVVAMASSGVSAGGTLAMNLAYNSNSVIPVKFVFQLAAPTYFEPNDWSLLKKVNRWNSNEEFLKVMTEKPTRPQAPRFSHGDRAAFLFPVVSYVLYRYILIYYNYEICKEIHRGSEKRCNNYTKIGNNINIQNVKRRCV